jgi:hypothetical protein
MRKKMAQGVPWWEAAGDRTTFYSGNRPDTSNESFLAQNGGPISEGDAVRARGALPKMEAGPVTAADEAAFQRVYGPKQEPAPFTGPALGSIDPVLNKPRSEFTSADWESFNQRQSERDAKNAIFKDSILKQRADFAKSPEGIIQQAQKLQRQAGLNPQQAIQLATAFGNPGAKPEELMFNLLAPQGGAQGIAAKGHVDVANANQAGNLNVANANNQGQLNLANANNAARDNFLKQQIQGNQNQALIGRGFVPNQMLGEQPAPQQQGPSDDVWRMYINALQSRQSPTRIPPPLQIDLPPQAARVMPQQGNLPGFTQLPPTPQEQMAINRAKQQDDLTGLQIQNERNKLNPTFPIDQQSAQRRAQLNAQASDPAFAFSEANKEPIAAAVNNWYSNGMKGELPTAIQSGLKGIYADDIYDNENSGWSNLGGLLGRGGWTDSSDADVYASYLENHYGIPRDVGRAWYLRYVKKSDPQGVPTNSILGAFSNGING